MTTSELVGLNTKWYRYKNHWTQEQFGELANFKTAYISVIETGKYNIYSSTIDQIAKTFHIAPKDLLDEKTAEKAKTLPKRVDMFEG